MNTMTRLTITALTAPSTMPPLNPDRSPTEALRAAAQHAEGVQTLDGGARAEVTACGAAAGTFSGLPGTVTVTLEAVVRTGVTPLTAEQAALVAQLLLWRTLRALEGQWTVLHAGGLRTTDDGPQPLLPPGESLLSGPVPLAFRNR